MTSNPTAQDALLPCPFCGGKPTLWNVPPHNDIFGVLCTGCGVEITHPSPAAAIAAWNRRAGTPTAQDERGEQ